MINLLIEIQKNMGIIKKNRKDIKEDSNVSLLKEMKKEFEAEKLNYKNIDNKFKKIEEDMKELEEKISKLKGDIKIDENKLYGDMKYDLKFMETLEKSIKLKENDIKKLEEDSLNLMYEEENTSKERSKSRKKLMYLKEKFYNCKESSSENRVRAKENIVKAEGNIKEFEQRIPKELLDEFNELCSVKGTGAAVISKGVCSGCKMKVSAVTVDDIKKNKHIVYCDNCGRIVHYNHSIE
ncbi:zinc ribbon domain-containing protein [Clostridium coskatii]|uniref:Zinc ribbon domain protein n=1 Tax=Clostridium coskatii TaxID=1705578 RepID=A0A166SKZ2_9CLOT|nr:C4-type zinc ribbon domain-containing protein [Clostridium coskatii]OAA92467.1 putative zinc ribbon domain protein [Clostridium coskatii]OBR89950.1 putative zinc ribbon domain protein [Clostridium coskatii]